MQRLMRYLARAISSRHAICLCMHIRNVLANSGMHLLYICRAAAHWEAATSTAQVMLPITSCHLLCSSLLCLIVTQHQSQQSKPIALPACRLKGEEAGPPFGHLQVRSWQHLCAGWLVLHKVETEGQMAYLHYRRVRVWG